MSDGRKLYTTRRFDWERIIRRLIVPQNLRAVKVVAYTLATYANADGTSVRPGEKRLVAECQLSERTVRDCLKYLRETGLIFRHSRGSNLGRMAYADVYQLCKPEKWEEVLPLLPAEKQGEDEPKAA